MDEKHAARGWAGVSTITLRGRTRIFYVLLVTSETAGYNIIRALNIKKLKIYNSI
jgi:hypothetical protein